MTAGWSEWDAQSTDQSDPPAVKTMHKRQALSTDCQPGQTSSGSQACHSCMNKTEAAEILATFVVVRARQARRTCVDPEFVAELLAELEANPGAATHGSLLHQAALTRPSYVTIRRAARRVA